jgi:hypothetical protein
MDGNGDYRGFCVSGGRGTRCCVLRTLKSGLVWSAQRFSWVKKTKDGKAEDGRVSVLYAVPTLIGSHSVVLRTATRFFW